MDIQIIVPDLTLEDYSIIVNIAVAIATFSMAYATQKMANTAQKTLDEQNKPYIIVYAKQRDDSPSILQVIIENIGTAPAYNVYFELSDNFYLKAFGIEKADRQPQKITSGAFIDGISQLIPRQKIVLNWGQYGGIKDSLQDKPAKITAKFNNAAGIVQPVTDSILDIRDFEAVSAATPTAVDQLTEIAKISKILESIAELLDRKLQPQSPEATYMWAYVAWKLLDGKYPYEDIYQYGKGAGLTSDQRVHAEKQARDLLQEYSPERD